MTADPSSGPATVSVMVTEAPDTTAPTITDLTPAPGSATTNRRPAIAATVTDDRAPLAADDLVLSVDGVEVTGFAYDATTGRLTSTPPKRLAPGDHSVRVLATDAAGNAATRTWSFVVLR